MFSQALINNLLKGSAVLGCTLLPLVVHAGAASLPSGGNNNTPGSIFSLDCGDSKVLVGLSGRSGAAINQLNPHCISISNTGSWIGSISLPNSSVGGSSGQFISGDCPRDTVIAAVTGRYTTSINRISLVCKSLTNTSFSSLVFTGSVLGLQSFASPFCANNKPARGFHGRAGSSINSLGLICHTGSTPTSPQTLPAPSNVVAVNLVNPQTGPSTSQATPYVQVQWTDQATIETGYLVKVFRATGIQQIVFNRPAAPSSGSRQALTIADLPSGAYTAQVCTVAASGATSCSSGASFTISGGSSPNPTACNPVITSAVRVGAGTGRVTWTHGCNNPSFFSIKLRCGSSPFGTVATAFDGAARQETFPFGVGSGVLQVCAVFPGQSATAFCSAQRSFQCN